MKTNLFDYKESLLQGFVDSFTWLLHCYCPTCLVRLVSSLRINQKFILTSYYTNLNFQFKKSLTLIAFFYTDEAAEATGPLFMYLDKSSI